MHGLQEIKQINKAAVAAACAAGSNLDAVSVKIGRLLDIPRDQRTPSQSARLSDLLKERKKMR